MLKQGPEGPQSASQNEKQTNRFAGWETRWLTRRPASIREPPPRKSATRKPRTDPALKADALAAIAVNWQEFGNSRPELVREHPRFAALLGEEAGEKGRRKYYRWLRVGEGFTAP